jgi:hypothetical protein
MTRPERVILDARCWEVRDNYPYESVRIEYRVQRGKGDGTETAATCWDYGLACLIEAALNLRDGTVE